MPVPPVLRYLGKWLVLASAVGLLAGSASAALLLALDWATATRDAHHGLIWLLPLAGLAVGWFYLRLGSGIHARAGSVADVGIEAGSQLLVDEIHHPSQLLPLRMAPLIFVATVLSHVFGASVGREGTAVQMGGALADQIGRVFIRWMPDRRTLLMAGISAGFASVFGTPLAGAVFGLEVLLLGRMRYRAWWPCLVAALVADRTTAGWGATHTTYAAGAVPAITLTGLATVALAGLIFGLAGRLFIACTHALSARMKRHIRYAPLRPLLGGCAIAAVVLATDAWQFVGLGIPTMADAFTQPLPWWSSAAKAALTVASIGSGFKGGEVTPLFFMGATLGNALAPLLHLPVGLLAALGFVAVFAGAAQTPVACIVMAMELFGAPIGTYATVACGMGFWAAGRQGLYRPSALIARPAAAETQAENRAAACAHARAVALTDAGVGGAGPGCVADRSDGDSNSNGNGNADSDRIRIRNGNANG